VLDKALRDESGVVARPAGDDEDPVDAAICSAVIASSESWISPSLIRPRSVSRIALGCSKISLSMKSSKPPFSAASRSHSTCIISGSVATTAPSSTSMLVAVTTSDLAVVQNHDVARVLEHRRYVAGNDVLALAFADDERRVLAGRDDGTPGGPEWTTPSA
jgi:hypothetical protein